MDRGKGIHEGWGSPNDSYRGYCATSRTERVQAGGVRWELVRAVALGEKLRMGAVARRGNSVQQGGSQANALTSPSSCQCPHWLMSTRSQRTRGRQADCRSAFGAKSRGEKGEGWVWRSKGQHV